MLKQYRIKLRQNCLLKKLFDIFALFPVELAFINKINMLLIQCV